jgi:hypothetical protein
VSSAPSLASCNRLADWLSQCGIKTVAMESTGVYWIPAYEILEERGFEVVLVNARDVHNVRGRKSDVSGSVGNFVFVSHTMEPLGRGERYGNEQGTRDCG